MAALPRPSFPASGWSSTATPISPPSAPASDRTCSPLPSATSPASRGPSPAGVLRCAPRPDRAGGRRSARKHKARSHNRMQAWKFVRGPGSPSRREGQRGLTVGAALRPEGARWPERLRPACRDHAHRARLLRSGSRQNRVTSSGASCTRTAIGLPVLPTAARLPRSQVRLYRKRRGIDL